ncbi:MAG: TIGR01777 family oxidoreductase [Candidatus Kapabacteria bacterium]|nr:TIGR01777 family oxidoreductase [Candidatus Kapabacteria bacterium]
MSINTIAIAGATGFIGRALVRRFAGTGYRVIAIARDRRRAQQLLGSTVSVAGWNELTSVVRQADVVINLSGAGIADQRWTKRRKAQLWDSRIEPTKQIVHALATSGVAPRLLLNASAIGYYGNRGDEILTEESSAGSGFLAELCVEWERTARQAESICRVVRMRFGVVLGSDGGMLKKLRPLVSTIGAVIPGTGGQWLSWIALQDVVRVVEWLCVHDSISGAINIVAPTPVTMAEFMHTLARQWRRRVWFHIPEFGLWAALGEMATTITDSIRALPARLQQEGFVFSLPSLEEAIAYNRMSS